MLVNFTGSWVSTSVLVFSRGNRTNGKCMCICVHVRVCVCLSVCVYVSQRVKKLAHAVVEDVKSKICRASWHARDSGKSWCCSCKSKFRLLAESFLLSRPSTWASRVVLVVKDPPVNAGDTRDAGSIPGSGRSPRGGNGHSLQYSCLENPMERGARWDTTHGIAESDMTESTYYIPHGRPQSFSLKAFNCLKEAHPQKWKVINLLYLKYTDLNINHI